MANELRLKLTTDISAFERGLRTASKQVEDTTRTIQKQIGGLSNLGSRLQDIGVTGLIGITAPIVAGVAAIAKVRGDIDSLERGLVAVAGNARDAAVQFGRLREVAKLPGLGLEEAVRASINLQAVGFSAQAAEKNIMAFGNALALVGRGKADLEEVVRQLGQLANRGKVTADNLKPILERVPQVAAIMRKEFGTVDTEVLQKMGVSADQFIAKIVQGLESLPKATGGIKNAVENAQDSIKIALNEFGRSLEPAIVGLLNFGEKAIQSLSSVAAQFGAMSPAGRAFTLTIVGLGVAIPGVIVALGSLASAFVALKKAIAAAGIVLSGPAGWAIGIASLVVTLGTGAYAASQLSESFTEADLAAQKLTGSLGGLNSGLAVVGGVTSQEAKDGIRALATEMGRARGILVQFEDDTPRIITLRSGEAAAVDRQTASQTKLNVVKGKEISLLHQSPRLYGQLTAAGQAYANVQQKIVDLSRMIEEETATFGATSTRGLDALVAGLADVDKIISQIGENDGLATIADQIRSIPAPPREVVDGLRDLNEAIRQEEILQLPIDPERWEREMERIKESTGKQSKDIAQGTRRAFHEVSTVFTDLSRDLARLIFEGGKFKDVMVDAAKQMGQALVRLVLQQALTPILNQITSILGKIPGLGKIFGAGTSAAGTVGGGIGSTGGLAQAISSSLGSVLTTVFSGISAISGVVGNFQNARQEGTLNAIEKETRYTQIHALNILEKLNALLPNLAHIHERLMEIRTFGVGVFPQPGYAGFGGGSGNAINYNHYGNVYGGPAGIRELTNEIVAELRKLGVKFG